MEPSEGHFDFDWLERAIDLAAKHHLVSVLGTPTPHPLLGLRTSTLKRYG